MLDINVPDALDARVDAIKDWKDGTAAAIRIALIAITTSISTKVKPRECIDNPPGDEAYLDTINKAR